MAGWSQGFDRRSLGFRAIPMQIKRSPHFGDQFAKNTIHRLENIINRSYSIMSDFQNPVRLLSVPSNHFKA